MFYRLKQSEWQRDISSIWRAITELWRHVYLLFNNYQRKAQNTHLNTYIHTYKHVFIM